MQNSIEDSTSSDTQDFKFKDSLLFRAVPCSFHRDPQMPTIWSNAYCELVLEKSSVLNVNVGKFKTFPLFTLSVIGGVLQFFYFFNQNIRTKTLLLQLQNISDYVNLELGFAEEDISENRRHIFLMTKEFDRERPSDNPQTQIIGFTELVEIKYGHKIIRDSLTAYGESGNILTLDPHKNEANWGVSKLWTHRQHRRLRIASVMLKVCCSELNVNENELAFSSMNMELKLFLTTLYDTTELNILAYFPNKYTLK